MNNDDKLYDDSDAQNSASEYNAENHYSVTSKLLADLVTIFSDRTVISAILSWFNSVRSTIEPAHIYDAKSKAQKSDSVRLSQASSSQ